MIKAAYKSNVKETEKLAEKEMSASVSKNTFSEIEKSVETDSRSISMGISTDAERTLSPSAKNIALPERAAENVGNIGKKVGNAAKTIPETEYQSILNDSIHNPDADKVMLGKYEYEGSPTNYIAKAGNEHTYFNMGNRWNEVKAQYGYSDNDMFYKFNIPFLDKQIEQKRPFYFSHDPINDQYSLGEELKYLSNKGYKYDARTMSAIPIK